MQQNFWASTKKKAVKRKKKDDSWKYSSYWLGSFKNNDYKSIFAEDKPASRGSKYDIFRLAEVRQAIANFVRILTQDNTIRVKFTEASAYGNKTDGKTVFLSPDLASDQFDIGVGLALHEASHIMHSDFRMANALAMVDVDKDNRTASVLFDFLNIVEDLYIDAVTYKSAPGYRGYYQAFYNKFFNSPDIDKALYTKKFSEETWENYFIHIVNIRNPKRNLKALKALETIWAMIDLPRIERLARPNARYMLACAIYDEVAKHVKSQPKQSMNQDGDRGKMLFDSNGNLASGTANASDDELDNNGKESDAEELDTEVPFEHIELSKTAMDRAEKLFAKQKDLVNGRMKKKTITRYDATALNNIESMDAEIRVVMKDEHTDDIKDGVRVVVIKNVTPDLIVAGATSDIGIHPLNSRRTAKGEIEEMTELVQRGVTDGKLLAKRIQIRNEERITKSTRLEAGKIDRRLINELGFDNFKIFSNLNIKTYKPVHVHVSIDQSGSMAGRRFNGSMQLAAMLATASTVISNLHVVVSLRGTMQNAGMYETPYVATIFDSSKHTVAQILNVFPYCAPHGCTPEALTFEALEREIKRTALTNDSYFINICDGEPSCYVAGKKGSFSYSGFKAREHCKKQMQMMERHGVKYMAYYLSAHDYDYTDNSKDHGYERVNACYPNHVIRLRNPSEINVIANTLNKRLLEEYNPA